MSFSRHSVLDLACPVLDTGESRVSRENGNLFPYSSLLSQGRRLDSLRQYVRRIRGNDNTTLVLVLRKLHHQYSGKFSQRISTLLERALIVGSSFLLCITDDIISAISTISVSPMPLAVTQGVPSLMPLVIVGGL